jgi:lipopolysaccharide biosynthesis protein
MEVIAYYLPQYYPFEENNRWWGEGFTEWTNVGKAKPLFRGHYQPKVPADLGYYDLRLNEVREKQAQLAAEAGVTGFCYWHYWFGNGKRLLDLPLKDLLESGKPNFPFCLGWANESWKSKVWSSDDLVEDKLLIEQEYPGAQDIIDHFYEILPALRDPRYIRIDGKPVLVIYKPLLVPNAQNFIDVWNDLAKVCSIGDGFFFIGHTLDIKEKDAILDKGFDAINIVRIGEHRFNNDVIARIPLKLILFRFLNFPLKLNYSFISKFFIQEIDRDPQIIPTLIPNWDHTARSGKKGVVFHESTPDLFEKHVEMAIEIIKNKADNRQLLFVKSWNEWGEGNYLEPDLKYGKKYISALKNALKNNK